MIRLKLRILEDSIPPAYTGIIEWDNDSIAYYQNGQLHRRTGPAFELSYQGINKDTIAYYKEWWLEGTMCSKEEHFYFVLETASEEEKTEILFNLERWS